MGRFFAKLLTLCVLFALLAVPAGAVDAGRLEASPATAQPNFERGEMLPSHLILDREETVPISNVRAWLQLIGVHPDLTPELRADLRAHTVVLRDTPPDSPVFQAALRQYDEERVDDLTLLRLPRALRARLPKSFLGAIYDFQFKEQMVPLRVVPFMNEASVQGFVQQYALGRDQERAFRDALVPVDGGVRILIFNESTAPAIPPELLRQFVEATDRGAKGLHLDLVLADSSDLGVAAQNYAGGRDPAPIERYLRRLREKHGPGEMRVPLQNILHRWIRRTVGTFADCQGPNCANSSFNVFRSPRRAVARYEWGPIQDRGFRPLTSGEVPRVGDLILYIDGRGEPVHVATYIQEGIVFTKNGKYATQPSIFQKVHDTEETYFPGDEPFVSVIWRPQAPGDAPMHPDQPIQPYRVKAVGHVLFCVGSLLGLRFK